MDHDQFIKELERRDYSHETRGDVIVVTHGGYVDLHNLTSLPEGTVFENSDSVYLSNLTSLPEGTVFENGGSVCLSSLTSLPEGTVFENSDSVYLHNLTSLPEGTVFENGGSVYLHNLTSLPEGTVFENGGYVDLSSLTCEKQTYRGHTISLRIVDHRTMLIGSERHVGEFSVTAARYFGGGPIEKLKSCYIATIGDHSAHGATVKQACDDALFKHLVEDVDREDLADRIKQSGQVTMSEFRAASGGACEAGVRHALEEIGLNPSAKSMALDDVFKAIARGTSGDFKQYGGEFMKTMELAA